MTADFDHLMVCLELYQAACLDHEDATAQLIDDRSNESARGQIAAAEAVIAARVSLYGCLVDGGWEPPPSVKAELLVDSAVVGLTTGALPG